LFIDFILFDVLIYLFLFDIFIHFRRMDFDVAGILSLKGDLSIAEFIDPLDAPARRMVLSHLHSRLAVDLCVPQLAELMEYYVPRRYDVGKLDIPQMTILFIKLLTDVPIEDSMLPQWVCTLKRFGVLSDILALDAVYTVHVDGIVGSVRIDAWAALQVCLHRLRPIIARDTSIHWTILKVIEWLSNRRRYGRSSMLSRIAEALGDVDMYASNIHTTASMYRDTDSIDKRTLLVKCVTILIRACKGTAVRNEHLRLIVDTPLFVACLQSNIGNHLIAALLESLLQTSLLAGIVVGAHLISRGVPVPRHIAVHVDRLVVQLVLHAGTISRSMYKLEGEGSSSRVQERTHLEIIRWLFADCKDELELWLQYHSHDHSHGSMLSSRVSDVHVPERIDATKTPYNCMWQEMSGLRACVDSNNLLKV
jgi:hypothetical protein